MNKPMTQNAMNEDTSEIQPNARSAAATLRNGPYPMNENTSETELSPGAHKKNENTSEIEPPTGQKILRKRSSLTENVNRMNENISEIEPSTGQKIPKKRSSLTQSKKISEIRSNFRVVRQNCNDTSEDARPKAFVGAHSDPTLESPLKIRRLLPDEGVVAKIDKPSSWIVRKIGVIMKACGDAMAWIKVHVFRQT